MTEDEFRIIERKMAINRGEVSADSLLSCGHPPTESGKCGITWCADYSVEWPEHLIEAECTRLLEQDGWRALRTDPVSDKSRGTGFGEKGMADHQYTRYACRVEPSATNEAARALSETLWIEYKSAKGKPAKHQTEWHTKERARGALTWIAGVDFPASVAGFVEHYRKSGLNRGRV